jgi:tetratricopeptide (TPR) repeat protein
MNPQSGALKQAGFNALKAGRLEEAAQAFQQAAGMDANDYDTYAYLGAVYARQKNFESSRRSFGRAVQLNPGSAKARFNLASAHQMAGDNNAARACFQAALDVDPEYAQAKEALLKLPVEEVRMSDLARPGGQMHLSGAQAAEFTDEEPSDEVSSLTPQQIAMLNAPGGSIHLAGGHMYDETDTDSEVEISSMTPEEIARLNAPGGTIHLAGAHADTYGDSDIVQIAPSSLTPEEIAKLNAPNAPVPVAPIPEAEPA